MNDHKGIQRKSKLSSTIAQIKKDSTNIRQKSKSKPKSKSKGKVVTSKYYYESLNSPKPIEYSKVMKKFGNNIVSYREQPTTPKNNTITYELNDNIGSNVPSNYKEYYTENYNKDISDLIHDNEMISPSRNKMNVNTNDFDEQGILNDIEILKNEVETLKKQSSRTKEKICVFIKLIRKYAKKLSSLSQIISPLTGNVDGDVYSNIQSTIEQFSQMIFNPKLNESVFDLSALLNEEFSATNISVPTNVAPDYSKELNSLMQKYEDKIKLLNEEKETMQNRIEEKIKNEKDYMNKIDILTKMNKEYENKIEIIENENKSMKEELKNQSEKVSQCEFLSNKLSTLETDLKYKENIISYLENLLKQSNINPNLNVIESIEEPKEEKNEIEDIHSDIEYENSNRPKEIKKEIDALDEEIFELQKKLRSMLNQNNN